ncbi:MAG: CBS domain-containing protein [Chloroflexi bacterium]|nr:CBS domain-containing protein [Chloroflexota bacterium]
MAEIKLVRDLMTVGVPTCPPDTPVIDVVRLLLDSGLDAVIVLDAEGHAVGVVSRDDLVRAYAQETEPALTAEAVMSEGVPQIPPDIPLTAAAQLMRDQGVRTLYLMHNADGITYPAAMLSYTHLLRHLAADSTDDLTDLGIKAEREPPLAQFFKRRDEARRRAAGKGSSSS